MNPVALAACRGNPEMLSELLAAGAPCIAIPGFGTPLHTALYQRWSSLGHRPGAGDDVGVVRALIAAGVEVPDDLRPSGDAETDARSELPGHAQVLGRARAMSTAAAPERSAVRGSSRRLPR